MQVNIKNIIFALLALCLIGWWQYNENHADLPSLAEDSVLLSLENAVIYQYGHDGKRKNRLSGSYIEHMKTGENRFIAPKIMQNIPRGIRVLQARFGEQSANGQIIVLHDNVFAREYKNHQPGATLHTDNLEYDSNLQTITTDSAVILDTPNSHITAEGMQWRLPQNLFILKKNIRSTYVPAL